MIAANNIPKYPRDDAEATFCNSVIPGPRPTKRRYGAGCLICTKMIEPVSDNFSFQALAISKERRLKRIQSKFRFGG